MKKKISQIVLLFFIPIQLIAQVVKSLPGIPQVQTEKEKQAIIKKYPTLVSSYIAAEMFNMSFNREIFGQYKNILLAHESVMAKSPRPAIGGAYWFIIARYYHGKDMVKAVKYYQKAQDWFEKENDRLGLIMAITAQIEIQRNSTTTTQGDTSLIRKKIQKTLVMAQEERAYEMEAILWNQLSAHWYSTQKNESLMAICSIKAKQALDKIPQKSLIHVVTMINLAQDTFNEGDRKKASDLLDSTYQLLQGEVKSQYLTFLCLQNIGFQSQKLNNLKKAEFSYLKSLESLDSTKLRELEQAYSNLGYFYSTSKIDYKKAHYYANKELKTKNELFKEQNNRLTNELQIQYETQKKEQENARLQTDNQLIESRNKTYLILISIISLILFTAIYLGWRTRKLNVALQKANTEIEEFNRTRSYLFGIIAHDLMRPAQAITGVSMLLDEYIRRKDWAEVKELGVDLAQSANQLQAQSENLIRWALVQKNLKILTKEWFEVDSILDDVLQIFKLYADWKKVKILVNITAEEKTVFADKKGLHLVLRNIIDNALKASPEGSTLTIQLQRVQDCLQIEIKDQGVGIQENTLEKIQWVIAHPFQHDRYLKDVGIGTVVIALFAQQNELGVEVTSTVNSGTQFIITFPAQEKT